MDALQEGMKDNMDTIKNNIAMLKAKIGIKSWENVMVKN